MLRERRKIAELRENCWGWDQSALW